MHNGQCFRFEIILVSVFGFMLISWILSTVDAFISMDYHGNWAMGSKMTERSEWGKFHPFLLFQGSISMLVLLAHLRLLFSLQTHLSIGPVYSSLANAFVDILRLILLFGLIMLAFSIALMSLYVPYNKTEDSERLRHFYR